MSQCRCIRHYRLPVTVSLTAVLEKPLTEDTLLSSEDVVHYVFLIFYEESLLIQSPPEVSEPCPEQN